MPRCSLDWLTGDTWHQRLEPSLPTVSGLNDLFRRQGTESYVQELCRISESALKQNIRPFTSQGSKGLLYNRLLLVRKLWPCSSGTIYLVEQVRAPEFRECFVPTSTDMHTLRCSVPAFRIAAYASDAPGPHSPLPKVFARLRYGFLVQREIGSASREPGDLGDRAKLLMGSPGSTFNMLLLQSRFSESLPLEAGRLGAISLYTTPQNIPGIQIASSQIIYLRWKISWARCMTRIFISNGVEVILMIKS